MILALYVDEVVLVNNYVNGLLKWLKNKLATSGVCHDRFGVTLAFGSIKRDWTTPFTCTKKYIEIITQIFKSEM